MHQRDSRPDGATTDQQKGHALTATLYRLAHLCVRRRFVVLGIWLVVAVALVAVSHRLGDNTNDNLSLPGTDSQQATDALTKSFPDSGERVSPIVLHAKSGKLTDSKYASAVNEAAADVAKAPYVASVVNPLTSQGASALSKDQSTGYLSVGLSVSPGSLSVGDAQKIIDAAAKPAKAAGLQVETGGQLGQKVSKPSTESSELIGIIAAMVILTFTFGTVVAMLLPIVTAIFGAGVDAGDHPPARPRGDGADGRADAGDDDRPGRGDRLRAVHRHPSLPGPATMGLRAATSRSRGRPRPRAGRCSSPAAR